MRTQFNVRLPEMTKKQVDEIATITGMTITQVLIMAIEILHRQIKYDERPASTK